MSSETRYNAPHLAFIAAALATGLALGLVCRGAADTVKRESGAWDPVAAAEQYRYATFELALARTGGTYMVLDLDRREIFLKVKGAVVWNADMEIAPGDSGDVEGFVRRFKNDRDLLLRMLESRHLFAAKEKTPDSILVIVGRVVKADPQLLQRDIPERFQLAWGWDLVLDVRTDIVGEPRSRPKNLLVSVLDAVRRPFGAVCLHARLASDDALTLYRAASPGMPTLIVSPLRATATPPKNG
jgi:hypothetical protein